MSSHPFRLKKDPRSQKEKKGTGVAGLPGATAAGGLPAAGGFDSGAAVLSTIGRISPTAGSQAGLWETLIEAVSRVTGLSTLAAGKAAIVVLVIGASSIAAGVSLMIGNSTSSSGPSLGGRVFAGPDESESEPRLKPTAAGESSQNAGSGMEYLAQANGPAPAPEAAAPERAVDAPAAVPAVKAAGAPNVIVTPAAPVKHADVPHGTLAKRAMPTARGETGGKITLVATDNLTKMGSGFQEVYRPSKTGSFDAMKGQRAAASRHAVLSSSGGNAMDQARFANRLSKSAARMGTGTAASHTSGQPFDGGNMGARSLGATRPGGDSIGGSGVSSSANSILDSRSVTPPPAPESKKNENKTSYQGIVMAAMAALLLGTVLLMAAGQMAGQAQKSPGPDAAAKIQAAQALAAAAMAAGGAAAGLGGMLAGQYGQMTQGMPFIMGGGILAVQAGMAIAKAEKAGQDGAQGVAGAGADAASQSLGALSGAMGPAMQAMQGDQGDSSSSEKPKPKPPPAPVVRPPTPHYGGNLPDP